MKRSSILQWVIATAIAVVAIVVAFHFDAAAREFIEKHPDRELFSFSEKVSKSGDWPQHLFIGALLAAAAYWRRNKKWTRVFVAMLIALTLAGVAARGLKIATARARPSVKTEELAPRSHFSAKYHSFPSGHVAASTAFFAVLAVVNWRVGLATLAIPLLIAWARMYSGAHYLSDVVCAALLGILCALLVAQLMLGRFENRQSEIGN